MTELNAKTVVAPIDFSELSMEAMEKAIDLVEPGGVVHVVHVLPVLPTMEYGNLYGTLTDASRREHVEENLRERLVGPRYEVVKTHVTMGDPGREITKFSEREKADLIVIPSHGYGFVKHMLLGSVAERVVRLAHCPVLVLRK